MTKRTVPVPAKIMIFFRYLGRTYRVSASSVMIRIPISQRTKRTSISKDPARNIHETIIISQVTILPIIRIFFDIFIVPCIQARIVPGKPQFFSEIKNYIPLS